MSFSMSDYQVLGNSVETVCWILSSPKKKPEKLFNEIYKPAQAENRIKYLRFEKEFGKQYRVEARFLFRR